ncbi:hypothetical protein [Aeromonas sp. MrichA-1]|uniref:hypothetical protein n=1 Tax=Aeromonas sp. MrichA-1 TaxID=2823362 RepID=UPI001B31E955|nr:hypothetical protein [Aeromonas sp. MrichA-1]MBP4081796.1 hypothetical protein [Aeromonas sp. MrichA-1]
MIDYEGFMNFVSELKEISQRDTSAINKFNAVMKVLDEESKMGTTHRRYDVARCVFESKSEADLEVFALLFRKEFSEYIEKNIKVADFDTRAFLVSNMMIVNYSNAKNHLSSANDIIMEVIREYAGESFEQIEKAIVRSIREFMERCWGPTADGKRDVEFYQWLKDSKEEEIGGFEYDYVFTGYCDEMIKKLQ